MAQIYADEIQVFVFICEHLRNLWLRIPLSQYGGRWPVWPDFDAYLEETEPRMARMGKRRFFYPWYPCNPRFNPSLATMRMHCEELNG